MTAPERPAAGAPPQAVAAPETVAAPEALPPREAPPRPAARAPDAKAARRARLEAKLRGGKGDLADAFALKRLCLEAGDKACLSRAHEFLVALTSGR